MLLGRHVLRTTRDLVLYVGRTGKWWLPLLIVLLAATATLVAATKVAVPTVVYTLF